MNERTPLRVHAARLSTLTPVRTGLLQRKCACGGSPGPDGECAECRRKRPGVQRKVTKLAVTPSVPPLVNDVLRSAGQPLDAGTRAFMEPRFGHDFGKVRVHTDERAAESARAVDAIAYTVGSSVVFGAGQYAPHTRTGKSLLAHELTHVVQQLSGRSAAGDRITHPSSPDEREADQVPADIDYRRSRPAPLPAPPFPSSPAPATP